MTPVSSLVQRLALAVAIMLAAIGLAPAAQAGEQNILAVAGDQPITQRDIDERIALLRILGDTRQASLPRKAILQMLVDDVVKRAEAARVQVTPTDAEITKQIAQVAKGMNLSNDQLLAKLQAQGVSTTAFRNYLMTQAGFSRIISSKYQGQFDITESDVDKKYGEVQAEINGRIAQIMRDPRMQGVTVYSLMEIDFPVETPDDPGLLQARAVDAEQVASKLKSCGGVKAASAGVFNVKAGKTIEADAAKLPPQMKSALDKAGIGHAIGPMRSKTGIQLLVLCGSRRVTPPKPKAQAITRDQVKNLLQNERFDKLQQDYLKTIRKNVYVEYRDPAYAP